MTKRLIIAAVFLIAAFCIGLFTHIYFVNTSELMIDVIDKAINADDEDVSEYIDELTLLWKENKRFFAILLKHSDADTADRYFLMLKSYGEKEKKEEKDETMLILRELKAFISVTLEGEIPKIENIF